MENNKNLFIWVVTLISAVLVLQLHTTGLSYDESYYWIYSKNLAWGYFDHPPMVGWLIYLGTLFGKSELLVRLPFLILSFTGFFLLYDLCGRLNKYYFLILLMSFPLFHGISFFAVPDTAQFFFGVMYFWLLKKYLKNDTFNVSVSLGVAIALLLYSKYHGILLVIFTIATEPRMIKRKSFWLVFVTAIICFLPHIWWEYKNNFISIIFHLSKRSGMGFSLMNVFNYLWGVLVLAGGVASIFYLKSLKKHPRNTFERIVKFNIVGIFTFFLFMSFRGQTEANWVLTIYSLLLIWVSAHDKIKKIAIYSIPAVLLLIAFRICIFVDDQGFTFKRLGELEKWDQLGQEIKKYCGDLKIATNNYQRSAKLSFYMDESVAALHITGRSSQYELLKSEQNYQANEKICFISNNEDWGGEKFMINYKGPIWINKDQTFKFWMDKKKKL